MGGVLIHEWIAQRGGSENVFEALSEIYPEEDLICLWNDSVGRFEAERLRETWLARTPLRRSKSLALPFMPTTWRRLRNREYEWALISSHLFAHHARFIGADVPRYVYVHSPARYIWTPELDRRGANAAVAVAAAMLKPLDRRRAHETRHFAANSEFVRQRIANTWGVDASVIHPPVSVTEIQDREQWHGRLRQDEHDLIGALPDRFVLGASRFIPYKQLDTVIRAGELVDLPVVLAGNGPELDRLRERASRATVPVQFVLSPSTPLLWSLYERCAVFVFPAVEDFGIMPVEAMAAGAPVVANVVGGAAESVAPGVSGALTGFDSDRDLADAIERAMTTDPAASAARAREFSSEVFEARIRSWVSS